MKPDTARSCFALASLLGALLLSNACGHPPEPLPNGLSGDILINQIGYEQGTVKQALLRTDSEIFEVITPEGTVVFKGEPSGPLFWDLSGDTVRIADFSAVDTPGTYRISVPGKGISAPFEIGRNLYGNLADAALKSYYYARCGEDIPETFGGKWHWKGGHPDTLVLVHASAADLHRPEGTPISAPGGWYDAGDYGKYIVNSSITTYTLLMSAALHQDYHQQQRLNIPESSDEVPDILNEALVNLNWMMTMQDPNDGGLYHKLTTKAFDGFIMPEATSAQRYVVQKSTPAALDFAATMAAASRVMEQHGMNDLAGEMKDRASRAWSWAEDHPDVFYRQPEDFSTGAYPDTSLVDERFWAASELYLLTGDKKYREKLMGLYRPPITPKWDVVNALGVLSLLTSERRGEFVEMERDFLAYADEMLQREKSNAYRISMPSFAWGSNSDVANDGMLKLVAYYLTGDAAYAASARNDLHYLLGRNATGYCFVTGFGSKSPMQPHNRIMSADGVEEPIPGYVVGGPNTIVLTDCEPENVIRSNYPAASYTDTQCSYSTNETAINWNAPLVFLSTGLSMLSGG